MLLTLLHSIAFLAAASHPAPSVVAQVSAPTASAVAAHVPVPVPTENRSRDKSRKLGKKKLPPI